MEDYMKLYYETKMKLIDAELEATKLAIAYKYTLRILNEQQKKAALSHLSIAKLPDHLVAKVLEPVDELIGLN